MSQGEPRHQQHRGVARAGDRETRPHDAAGDEAVEQGLQVVAEGGGAALAQGTDSLA